MTISPRSLRPVRRLRPSRGRTTDLLRPLRLAAPGPGKCGHRRGQTAAASTRAWACIGCLYMDHLDELKGSSAIGHVRYSTTGSSILINAQPFVVHHRAKAYAVAHNGNLVNAHVLKDRAGRIAAPSFRPPWTARYFCTFSSKIYTMGFEKALIESGSRIKGAFSLIVLTSKGEVIGIKDPHGFRPLVPWAAQRPLCAGLGNLRPGSGGGRVRARN